MHSVRAKKKKNREREKKPTAPAVPSGQHCLTSVIRREPVYSVWFGRRHKAYSNNSPYGVSKALNSPFMSESRERKKRL